MNAELRRPRLGFSCSKTSTLAAYALAFLAYPTGCGADHSIVGGECAVGYTQCGLVCIDTALDPANCGACGVVCADGVCINGECGGSRDSGQTDSALDAKKDPRDASTDGALYDRAVSDEGILDGNGADAHTSDGGLFDAAPSDADSEGSTDSPSEGSPSSDAACSPPTSSCAGVCVDEATDPNNCGGCETFCPSGICTGGVCDGSTEGDIVIIGHDYHSSLSALTAPKLLTNAVLLPTTDPVRIFSFEHYADPVSVANVKSIVNAGASHTGRNVRYTVSTSDDELPSELTSASFDVLIVYDQEAAMPGVLGPLGSSWAATLGKFTAAGGVIISLDGAAGSTREMPVFDTQAGLLAVSQHTVIPSGTALDVVAPGDAIGHGVFSPYQAEPNSVYFTTSEPNGGSVTYVVEDTSFEGKVPVVVHKAVP